MEGLKALIREKLHCSPSVAELLEKHPELRDDPALLLQHLEEKGFVEDIFGSLETVLQQQQRWPAVGASAVASGAAAGVPETLQVASLGANKWGAGDTAAAQAATTAVFGSCTGGDDGPSLQLMLRLIEGRAFLDYLDERDACNKDLQWHVSFGCQRHRTRPVPAAVDPRFDSTIFVTLPQGASRTSLSSHAAPLHLILLCRGSQGAAEDPWDHGNGTLLCSHFLEWRECLAVSGPRQLVIELQGVGRRRQLAVGVLHAEVELRPAGAAAALLGEAAVSAQVSGEEQRRAEIMRRVFEDLDRWWAQYHQVMQSRYVCLFAQTESCLFLPVTSFVTPLEAGRVIDSPAHAFRWVTLIASEPRPALESSEPRWHTFPALWARGRGTVEERSLLLCSLLLGYSLDAWCCLGTDSRGQPHAWVIVRDKSDDSKPSDVVCWDVLLALRIRVDSPQYLATFSSIDLVFNHKRCLVCHAGTTARVSFDFGDIRCWLPVPLDSRDVDALRLYPALRCPPFADLKPRMWSLPLEPEAMEEVIERRLAGLTRSHREAAGLQTFFDDHLSQLLHMALVNCELERTAGSSAQQSEQFAEVVRRVCNADEVFRAVPAQFNHLRVSLFWPALTARAGVREALATVAGPPAFALRVRVVPYPENTVATWVLLGVRCGP
eukprot:TRINITY_DN55811_c0_g1_i1.p1 TRINITY_DN55811_c0_g1~~TRINITY_DN55811_c0_g1_i1.p1  ORF type:complete len:663 (+),score=82.83 TRINITY_DN55811_c0_g1_i1:100-2088(+)